MFSEPFPAFGGDKLLGKLITQLSFISIPDKSQLVADIQRLGKQQTQLIDQRKIILKHCKRVDRKERCNDGQLRFACDMLRQHLSDLFTFVIYNLHLCSFS